MSARHGCNQAVRLQLTVGQHSSAGRRERNEDAIGWSLPQDDLLTSKGALFALADGVSGCADGRLAARSSVRAVCADYYATPETWAVSSALDKLLLAHNRWLRSQGKPLVAALSALVLRGQRYTVAHIGDCRIYHLSRGRLRQLTVDHVWEEPSLRHVLKRGMGLDEHVMPDFCDGDLAVGDVFALLCDGVWGQLGDKRIDELLRLHSEPQRAAEVLCAEAAASVDNLSALVLRVDALPAGGLADELARATSLPVPPRLREGQVFEELQVLAVLHVSAGGLAYRVVDKGGRQWVLKTLPALLAGDAAAEQALLVEEWLHKRVSGPCFTEVASGLKRAHLYYLQRWHEGETLAARQRRQPFAISEVVAIGLSLCRAMSALHRLGIVHRDIKPDNLHLGRDGQLRLLDLGVASCAGLTPQHDGAGPGTPSFMAPECFDGVPASSSSDLYAAGVTLYQLLSAHYPYGEVEAFQTPSFGAPQPASRYRPDVPLWLDNLLLKAVARDAASRFETAEEMQLALERGDSVPQRKLARVPWAQRAPLRLWRGIALLSLLFNLILIYVLLLG